MINAAGSLTRITLGKNEATGRGAPGRRKAERFSSMYLELKIKLVNVNTITSDKKKASEGRRMKRTPGPKQPRQNRTKVYWTF